MPDKIETMQGRYSIGTLAGVTEMGRAIAFADRHGWTLQRSLDRDGIALLTFTRPKRSAFMRLVFTDRDRTSYADGQAFVIMGIMIGGGHWLAVIPTIIIMAGIVISGKIYIGR